MKTFMQHSFRQVTIPFGHLLTYEVRDRSLWGGLIPNLAYFVIEATLCNNRHFKIVALHKTVLVIYQFIHIYDILTPDSSYVIDSSRT